jgi:hypothetical protein
MTRKKLLLLGAVTGVVAFVAVIAWPRPGALVAKYICSPVPQGVREVSFETSDPFGVALEYSRHLSFTAPPEAMAELIGRSSFQPSSIEFASGVPRRPREWPSFDRLGPGARAYFRVHRPSRNGKGLRIGQNRRWSEVLVVDGTGTNGFFTMWDTD